jgi:FHS family glucose/mannose:H+ symporter-like MFS transporter
MPAQRDETTPNSYLSLYATTFLVGVVMISLGPLLDPILRELDIPLSQAGLLSAAFAVGMLIGVVALNFFLAKVPAPWAIIGAVWVQTAGLAACGVFAQNLWSLSAAYFFVGLGIVFLNSLPGMWVSSHVKTKTHRAMVVLLLFFAIGMMIAPVIIGIALGLGATWRGVFIGEAVLSLLVAVLLTVRPISDIAGRENLRLPQLRAVIGFNPALFVSVLAASLLYIGSEFILNVWLPKFAIDTFAVSKTAASITVTLFWVGLVLGRLLVLPLTKRYVASRLLAVGMAVMAVFALGVALSTSVEMAMVMAFFSGLGASAAFPLILGFSGRFPSWHAGVVYSAVIMAGALGRIVFPYLIGPIADEAGFRVAMGLAFVLAGACSLLALYLHRVSGEGDAAG